MLTKTLLALSLIAGSTFAIASYSQSSNFQITSLNPLQITQLPQQEIDSIARNITVKVRNAENEGSGILIAKDDDTYTVITNASLTDGENYIVQTPDGIQHEATITGDNPENDLAILEFTSDNQYQTATIGNSDSLTAGETVIAAGFPESKQELLVTEGKISLLTEKPLNKGYSIGFTNETVQGMSGGVLLNANGEVIGVLGKGKGAILDTAYDYADGTTPTNEEIATFREVAFSIPIQNIANLSPQLAALVPGESNQPEIAQQPEYTGIVKTVDDIAQQITVRLATPEIASYGSGVIIAKDGNTYYVATVAHNFPEGTTDSYQIVTSDGESHELDLNTVKKSDAYDFALFSFESDKEYTVATIGNYTVAANSTQVVFTSGFPGMYAPQRIITGGKVREQVRTSFNTKNSSSFAGITADRPGLLYSNLSYKGMSGGAVLDSEGRLVGINTGAENEAYFDESGNYSGDIALGFSLGISLEDVLTFIDRETPLKTEWLQTTKEPAAEVNQNDYSSIEAQLLTVEAPKDDTDLVAWMNYGNRLWRYGRNNEAIDAFEKATTIDPQFDLAYYGKALAYGYQAEYQQVIETLNKAIEINPNPYYYWRDLGFYHGELKQYDEALAAYEEAITGSREDFVLYLQRADYLREAERYEDAIESYNKALELNPEHPWIYNNRGLIYYDLAQYDDAIADFTEAIELSPQTINAYNNRGAVYQEIEQYEQALTDLNKAIELKPQDANAYNNRANVYYHLEQYEPALSDLNRAIELDPELAKAYYVRGAVYVALQKLEKAIADFTESIKLDPEFSYVYYNRGAVYGALQQYDEAISDFTRAIALNPDRTDTYNNRGTLYNEVQQYDEAISDFTRAIDLDPQFTEAYINRGDAYTQLEQYEAAEADFTQAIEINPQLAQAYLGLGVVYAQLNDIEAARINLEKARQLFISQNNTAVAETIANILEQLP